jgi:hypothetical protein
VACETRASDVVSALGGSRTPNLLIRSRLRKYSRMLSCVATSRRVGPGECGCVVSCGCTSIRPETFVGTPLARAHDRVARLHCAAVVGEIFAARIMHRGVPHLFLT